MPFSPAGGAATPTAGAWMAAPQLSYLPLASLLGGGIPVGVPMCIPLHLLSSLQDGKSLNVIVSALDEEDGCGCFPETPAPRAPAERKWPKKNKNGRREQRERPTRLTWVPTKTPAILHPLDLESLKSEAGSRDACLNLSKCHREVFCHYAGAVMTALHDLCVNEHGARFVKNLVDGLPFGRETSYDSYAGLLVHKLVHGLPGLAMNPHGKAVYLSLLLKCSNEEGPASQVTRRIAKKLTQTAKALAQCPHGSVVLQAASKTKGVKEITESAVAEGIGEICGTYPGRCLISNMIKGEQASSEVAMALLESEDAFVRLAPSEEWCSLLTEAAKISHLHRGQLAETLRHMPQEVQDVCCPSVKLAACWQ